MWIDAEGVVHTVALPDPTVVMSDGFRSGLDQIISQDAKAVAELVEVAQNRFFDGTVGTTTDLEAEDEYAGVAPPLGLLDTSVRTTEDLRSTIAAVDLRWRLDVLMALEDYVS